MLDGRDLASITSGGNREEHFDFSQTLQTSGQKGAEFGKTHFLKRGCHKILSMTTKSKAEQLLSLHTQRTGFSRQRTSGSNIYDRSPIGVNKNRMN